MSSQRAAAGTHDARIRELLQGLRAGRPLIVDGESGTPAIAADSIRRVFDRRLRAGDRRRRPSARIEIRGARIGGQLDLRDCLQGAEAGPPAVVITDCILEDGIVLDDTRLLLLDVTGSRFPFLSAERCRIDGDVLLAGVQPVRPDGDCRVVLSAARIGGTVEARRAGLRHTPRTAERRLRDGSEHRYAFELQNAEVEGRLTLTPGFVAHGGVNLRGTRVRGETWMCGARITAGEGAAVRAQSMVADGVVVLRSELIESDCAAITRLTGEVSFSGARIRGELDLDGVHIDDAPLNAEARERGLLLSRAQVKGFVLLGTAWLDGRTVPVAAALALASAAPDDPAVYAGETLAPAEAALHLPLPLARLSWRPLDAAFAARLAGELEPVDGERSVAGIAVSGWIAETPFYPEYRLVCLRFTHAEDPRTLLVLTSGLRTVAVPDTSPERALDAQPPALDDDETALDYLRYYFFATHLVKGPCSVLEPPPAGFDSARAAPSTSLRRQLAAAVLEHARPIEALGRDPEGNRRFRVVLAYDDSVTQVVVALTPAGSATVVKVEKRLATDEGIAPTPAWPRLESARTRALPRPVPFRCTSDLWLDHAEFGGVGLQGAQVRGQLNVGRTRIAGLVSAGADPSTRFGQLLLTGARVDGSIELCGTFGAVRTDGAEPGDPPAVSVHGASIGGDLRLGESVDYAGVVRRAPAVLHGGLDLEQAQIGRDLVVRQARIRGPLNARRARIGVNTELRQVTIGHDSPGLQAGVRGDAGDDDARLVNFDQAEIGGNLVLERVCLRGDSRTREARLSAQAASVKAALRVRSLFGERSVGTELTTQGQVRKLRRRRLECYPGWDLYEAEIDAPLCRVLAGRRWVPEESGVIGLLVRREPAWRAGGVSEVRQLTGKSSVFHDLNGTGALRLDTPRQAREYLELFTSYVWGEAGSFRIVDPDTDARLQRSGKNGTLVPIQDADPDAPALPALEVEPDRENPGDYLARATLIHGNAVFEAQFAIRAAAREIEMVADRKRAELKDDPGADLTRAPVRFASQTRGDDGFPATLLGGWQAVEGRQRKVLDERLRKLLKPTPPAICLRDAKADRLDDLNGDAWRGELSLELDGFEYARAPMEPDSTDLRTALEADRALLAQLRTDEYADAAIDAVLAGRIRMRALACHDEWRIVEVRAILDVGAREEGGRPGRSREALTSFLWRPCEAVDGLSRADGLPLNVIPLRHEMAPVAVGAIDWRITSKAAGAEFLRVHLAAGGLDGRRWRIVTPGDPALPAGEGAHGLAIEPSETDEVPRFRFRATLCDGVTLCDADGEVDGQGAVRIAGRSNERPAAAGWSEFDDGPFRVLDVDRLVDETVDRASAWDASGWESLPPARAVSVMLDALPAFDGIVPPAARRPIAQRARVPVGWLDRAVLWIEHALRGRPLLERPLRGLRRLVGLERRNRLRLEARLRWLNHQYPAGRANERDYRPHPYEVAAAVFRNEGDSESARAVLSHKLSTENRLRRRLSPFRWVQACNRFFFDYGLSPRRAISWTIALFAGGWLGVAEVNRAGLLVLDFTPAATMLVPVDDASGQTGFELASIMAEAGSVQTPVPCGNHISEAVFAADLMVPVLDLGQAKRCQIRGARPGEPRSARMLLDGLRIAQGLFAVLGAIFLSMTLLTISGVLRRHAES